jgi:prepilin-type N-terminal cleavage/methylation domain-containing protein
MKASKGFTVIELIVVISIFAILASIVLVNVRGSRDKSKDAAAKRNLVTLMTVGVKYFEKKGNYNNFFQTIDIDANDDYIKVNNAMNASNMGYTIEKTCDGAANCTGSGLIPNATKWCAMVILKVNGETYCVDSLGKKIEKTNGTCINGICN